MGYRGLLLSITVKAKFPRIFPWHFYGFSTSLCFSSKTSNFHEVQFYIKRRILSNTEFHLTWVTCVIFFFRFIERISGMATWKQARRSSEDMAGHVKDWPSCSNLFYQFLYIKIQWKYYWLKSNLLEDLCMFLCVRP